MGKQWIEWDDSWIIENYSKYNELSHLWKAYVRETDHDVKQQSFRTHVSRKLSLKSSATWTPEEKEWIRNNFSEMGSLKAVKVFNEFFGKTRTDRSISAEARRQGLYVDEQTVLDNKNYSRRVSIGTIVDDGDGYLKIKTGNGSSGWERYHRYLWEQRNGKIPKGYKVIFLNGNKQDYSEENLVCVPSSYLALMNKNNLKSENPKITETAIKWCDLYVSLGAENKADKYL